MPRAVADDLIGGPAGAVSYVVLFGGLEMFELAGWADDAMTDAE
jgi:hypothetical protein